MERQFKDEVEALREKNAMLSDMTGDFSSLVEDHAALIEQMDKLTQKAEAYEAEIQRLQESALAQQVNQLNNDIDTLKVRY